jgi:RNA polymerase sigma-70 factor (ECF subfamily)
MSDGPEPPDDTASAPPPLSPQETIILLRRVQSGDEHALNDLLSRLLPRLRRWAHRRLPESARGMIDTGDIVQTVAVKAVKQLARFEPQEEGSLGWYLRRAITNEIASQWRKAARTPPGTSLPESLRDPRTMPLDHLLRAERLDRLDTALGQLEAPDRDAIVGRFELDYSYDELARYLGRASAEAARVAVHRAVKRLIERIRALEREEGEGPAAAV